MVAEPTGLDAAQREKLVTMLFEDFEVKNGDWHWRVHVVEYMCWG